VKVELVRLKESNDPLDGLSKLKAKEFSGGTTAYDLQLYFKLKNIGEISNAKGNSQSVTFQVRTRSGKRADFQVKVGNTFEITNHSNDDVSSASTFGELIDAILRQLS